eukprot:COSAG04_NODE_3676_length_2613_cov_7.238663_6_plen_353_part_00
MSRRSKKVEPAPQTLLFPISVPPTPGSTTATYYIDVSQCASLVNRRFYRQGINWPIAGFKFVTGSATGLIAVSKLPSTWVFSNAWEKSFRTWQRMNDEALEESESIKPRFLDFKVFADAGHHAVGAAGNLLPSNLLGVGVGADAAAGEWKYSKITIPDNNPGGISDPGSCTDYDFVATGANYPGVSGVTGLDAVSLIEGYAASRGLPPVTDPNVPTDADDVGPDTSTPQNWMSSVFTEGTEQTEDVLDRMTGENNLAPYPFEGATVGAVTFSDTMYPGGQNQMPGLQVHDIETVTSTTVGGITRIKGGLFPCGLIRIDVQNASPTDSINLNLLIDLVPGHHRGYLCEPMTEM